jgi:nucleoside-diphosphate-sugar epimerase
VKGEEMAILITGGTGYLGPYLAQKLIEEGEDKLILFDFIPNPNSVGDIAEHVEIVQGDITEPFELMAVLKQHDISHIFHLAYLGPEGEMAPSRGMRVNILGTYNVFEAARQAGVKRVIWATSAAAYGIIETSNKVRLLREEDRPMPITLYGASKLFNEHVAENLARNYGFDHIGLRMTSVYGLGRAQRRGVRPDIYWGLIEQSARGEEVRVPPGDHLVNWSYVKDCADAFYHAYKVDKPKSRLFNFTGEIRPVKDAVDYVKTLFPNARITMGSKGERTLPYLDGSRIRSELGFEPRYSMERGIKDYVDLLSHRRT